MTTTATIPGLVQPYLLPATSWWEDNVLRCEMEVTKELVEGHFRERPLVPLLVFCRFMLQTALQCAGERGLTNAKFKSARRAKSKKPALLEPPVRIRCAVQRTKLTDHEMMASDVEAFVAAPNGEWELYAILEGLKLSETVEDQEPDELTEAGPIVAMLCQGYELIEEMDALGIARWLHEAPPFLNLERAWFLKGMGGHRMVALSRISPIEVAGYRDGEISVVEASREQAVTAELLCARLTGKPVVPIAVLAREITQSSRILPGLVVAVADFKEGSRRGEFLTIEQTGLFGPRQEHAFGMRTIQYFPWGQESFLRGDMQPQ